jgi:hypothetical protein
MAPTRTLDHLNPHAIDYVVVVVVVVVVVASKIE